MISNVIDGFKILIDNNIPFKPLYPTGKKDGNKLGKRKKKLRATTLFIYGDKVVCHLDVADKLIKQLKNKTPVEVVYEVVREDAK